MVSSLIQSLIILPSRASVKQKPLKCTATISTHAQNECMRRPLWPRLLERCTIKVVLCKMVPNKSPPSLSSVVEDCSAVEKISLIRSRSQFTSKMVSARAQLVGTLFALAAYSSQSNAGIDSTHVTCAPRFRTGRAGTLDFTLQHNSLIKIFF